MSGCHNREAKLSKVLAERTRIAKKTFLIFCCLRWTAPSLPC
jgi:hypothetical protein